MRSAFGLPEPNTTWVRPCASAQRVQVAVSSACARSAAARSTASIEAPVYGVARMVIRAPRRESRWLVAAAARAAAAPAATAGRAAERRLRRRAVHCEARELLQDVRSTTLGTRDRLVARADELVEVRLALHARVLVDRHAPSVLSRGVEVEHSDARRSPRAARAIASGARGGALAGIAGPADVALASDCAAANARRVGRLFREGTRGSKRRNRDAPRDTAVREGRRVDALSCAPAGAWLGRDRLDLAAPGFVELRCECRGEA